MRKNKQEKQQVRRPRNLGILELLKLPGGPQDVKVKFQKYNRGKAKRQSLEEIDYDD